VTTTASTAQAHDGRTLAYETFGPADGAPVFWLHGTPSSRLYVHPEPAFYDRHGVRAIAYDRPGYGGSQPDAGRDVAAAAADIESLADALGVERFGVLGTSGGGPHALACGARLAERVTGVAVFVGAAPFDDSEFDMVAGMSPSNVEEFGAAVKGRDELAKLLDAYVAEMAEDALAPFDAFAHELPARDQEMLRREDVRAMLRASSAEAVRQGAEGWIDDDLAFVRPWGFALEAVRPEVRLWQGSLDVLVPRAHAEYLAGKLPNASFTLVDGAGHFILDEWAFGLEWLVEAAAG
jgi:pimeloyl-ACP methyl ester carboxylesterase